MESLKTVKLSGGGGKQAAHFGEAKPATKKKAAARKKLAARRKTPAARRPGRPKGQKDRQPRKRRTKSQMRRDGAGSKPLTAKQRQQLQARQNERDANTRRIMRESRAAEAELEIDRLEREAQASGSSAAQKKKRAEAEKELKDIRGMLSGRPLTAAEARKVGGVRKEKKRADRDTLQRSAIFGKLQSILGALRQGGMGTRDLGTLERAFDTLGKAGVKLSEAQQRVLEEARLSRLLSKEQVDALHKLSKSVESSRQERVVATRVLSKEIKAVTAAVGRQGELTSTGLSRIRQLLKERGLSGEDLNGAERRIVEATLDAVQGGREAAAENAERILEELEAQRGATAVELRAIWDQLEEDPEQAAREAALLEQLTQLTESARPLSRLLTRTRRPDYAKASPGGAGRRSTKRGAAQPVRSTRAGAQRKGREPKSSEVATPEQPAYATASSGLVATDEALRQQDPGRQGTPPQLTFSPGDEGRASAFSPGEVATPLRAGGTGGSVAGRAPKELLHTHTQRACKHVMNHVEEHGKRKSKDHIDALKEVHGMLEKTLKYVKSK